MSCTRVAQLVKLAHEQECIHVNDEYSLFDKHTKRQTSESCMKLQNGSKYYDHTEKFLVST